MDHEMFEPQVRAFRDRYRVITWDQRGHGLTEGPPAPFTYWDSADDLTALLDHLGIDRAILAGMSQGGFVIQRFALRHPDRVIGLVLIDSQAGQEDPDKVATYDIMRDVWVSEGPTEMLADMVAALIIGPWDRNAEWTTKWRTLPADSIIQPYRTLNGREDLWHRMPEITAPVLVIHGEADAAIDISIAERMAEVLPNARPLVRIPGGARACNLTHPEPVNRAMADFLGEIAPTA